MLKVKYIKTTDFTFENVEILNCSNKWKLAEKIRNNDVISIRNEGATEYINTTYIMFYELEE